MVAGLISIRLPQQTVLAATSSDLKKEIKALEGKLSQTKSAQASLRSKMANNKAESASLEQQIQNLDTETTLISDQLSTIEDISAQWESQQALKKDEIGNLQKQEVKERDRFNRMVRMSYEYGSDSYLELIFGAKSFSDFLSRMDLISYHLTYNEKVLKALAENQKNLEQSQQDYEESSQKLDELFNTRKQLKSDLENKIDAAKDKKQALYSKMIDLEQAEEMQGMEAEKLLAETRTKSNELKIVTAQEAEILRQQKLLERGQGKVATPPKVNNSNGQFLWPLPDNYTNCSSPFANRINPITKKKEFHNGLDLPAPARTPIYAADGGTVVLAKWNGGYGNCVTINHGNGYITLYGHCSSLNVTAGQVVGRGDVIGFVGSTGLSTGNHLHFTVFSGGTAVDPAGFF